MKNTTDKDLLLLYRAFSKSINAFAILIDEVHKVHFHTEELPDYFTPQKKSLPLSHYLPTDFFAAIHHQIIQQMVSKKTSSSESATFIYDTFCILVNVSIQTIEYNETPCFAITITEINRNSERTSHPSPEKQVEKYSQEHIAPIQELTYAKTTEDKEHLINRITDIFPGTIYVYDLVTQKNLFSSGSIGIMLGYSDIEVAAMGDQVLAKLILAEDFPKAIDHHVALGKIKDDSYRILEYRMRSKAGRIRWYSSHDKIFDRDKAGNPTKIIGLAQDITEQKTVLFELERINNELKRFSYAASHDLKEPLNTITTIIELLPDMLGEISDEAHEFLGMLDGSTSRMRRLITDLLDYSLLGSGQISFEKIDLNKIVSEVLSDLDGAIKRTNAKVTIASLPTLFANTAQLKRLFQNLISNALKYHASGRIPQVSITAEEKQNYWLFSIIDNGIGIAEKNQIKIFQVFQKLHSSHEYEGTGIGLASCQRIIENHQGEIGVSSKLGEGSTFYFSIPMNL